MYHESRCGIKNYSYVRTKNYRVLFSGDFGNSGKGALNNIYRVVEPDDLSSQTIHVGASDKLEFS